MNPITNSEVEFKKGYDRSRVLQTVKWILSILLILLSLFAFFKDNAIIAGMSFLLLGLLLIPPIYNVLVTIIPIYEKRIIRYPSYLLIFLIAASGLPNAKSKSKGKTQLTASTAKDSSTNTTIEKFPKLYLKTSEVIQGNKNSKRYYYGLYLRTNKDTSGAAKLVMDYMNVALESIDEHDVVHLWVFIDSTIIPKSFSGNWNTPKIKSKCFAHVTRLSNGYRTYDFDIFTSYK